MVVVSDKLSPVLIPVVRGALASQGYSPNIVRGDGSFDFSLLAASTFDTVEIWTEYTGPVTVNVAEALKPGPPHPLLAFLKPTIVLSGPAGQRVIAPYGTAARDGGWKGPALVAGVFVGVFLLGKL